MISVTQPKTWNAEILNSCVDMTLDSQYSVVLSFRLAIQIKSFFEDIFEDFVYNL